MLARVFSPAIGTCSADHGLAACAARRPGGVGGFPRAGDAALSAHHRAAMEAALVEATVDSRRR